MAVLNAEGKELARSESAQHNRGYGTREETMAKLAATALKSFEPEVADADGG